MMITILNEELKVFEKLANDFAEKELLPEREKHDKYPFAPLFSDVIDKAHEIGFFGITLPEDMGGVGQGSGALCTILNFLCREDSSLGGIIFVNTVSQQLLLCAGSGDLLKDITANAKNTGEYIIAFPAFNNPSEINHCADAKKDGDRYILSGSLEYCVLGGIAGHGIIPARIEGEDGYSFFMVELSDNGIEKSGPVFSLGFHACPAVDLKMKDVTGTLIGKSGEGNSYFESMADKMYVSAAAISAGIVRGCYNEAYEYMNERIQGGREIINWSALRMMLAGLAVKLQVSEMTVAIASNIVDNKKSGWELCSRAAAIHVQEMATDLTTDGIQLLGGYGYMKDYGQEKRFRDASHAQALLGLAPLKKLQFLQRMID